MSAIRRRLSDPIHADGGPVACLLLHGFAGSPAEIRPLADHLIASGLTVRAPLLPGHGTHPEDLRRTRWADWAQAAEVEFTALRERYGAVHIVGFSMGGLLALYLAARFGAASVVTLSCPSRLGDWRQILVPLARYIVPYYPARISNPEIAAQVESYDKFPLDAVHSLIQLAEQVRGLLSDVSAPLLAVQGDRDKWIAPDSAEFIAAHVSSASKSVVRLPGRNHLIALEQGREEVFGAVLAWILSHVTQSDLKYYPK